jgi:signal peptidase II
VTRGVRSATLLFASASTVYLLDRLTKVLAERGLEGRPPIELLPGVRLAFTTNAGGAFSIGGGTPLLFVTATVIVSGVIVATAARHTHTMTAVALGLVLGGALGNLTDRIFRSPGIFQGEVVDFIAPKGFAVFNLADSAIVCGGILIVLLSFRGLDPDGTVHKD